jgi:CRP-like cAMP-binding protein
MPPLVVKSAELVRLPFNSPHQNHLLDTLPADDYERLAPHLDLVKLKSGDLLFEPNVMRRYVYFPTTSIASLTYALSDGHAAEFALVGNEGMLGASLVMGGLTTPSRVVVLGEGYAYRLKALLVKTEFARFGSLFDLLLRYILALIAQTGQTAVCNRHHSLDQQLCRWFLMAQDRQQSSELSLTQELVSSLLGVRREGVTDVVGNLQRAGLIDHRRGRITLLDRKGLEARACECYQIVNAEYGRLLPYIADDRRASS